MRKKVFSGWLFVLLLLYFAPHAAWGAETTKWFNLGIQAKKDSAKIKYFTKVIEINPNHISAFNNRGNAYSRKNKPLRAVADFSRAVELDPKYWQSYYNRGLSYKDEQLLGHAIQDFSRVIMLKPEFAGGYRNRGISYARKGRTQKAITDLSRSVGLSPDKFRHIAYYHRAVAHKRLKRYARAFKDYEMSLRLKPDYVSTLNNLAWMLATVRDGHYRKGERAVMLAKRAVQLSPTASNLDTLAAAYAETGQFGDATRTERRAIAKLGRGTRSAQMARFKRRLESYDNHRPWRAD